MYNQNVTGAARNGTVSEITRTDASTYQPFNIEFTSNSNLFSTVSENNIFHKTTLKYLHNTTDFNSTNSSINIEDQMAINDDIGIFKVQVHNETVFADYPPELLCFGAICFVVFAIVGVFGNFISILALSKCKRLRNATTAFIVNLCVADLLFCSFSMPLSALTFIERNWYYGAVLCKLFPLIRYSNGAVSVFSVIAITINRYVLIVHPRIYPLLYKRRNIAIMIGFIWFLSLLLLLFPLFGVWGTLGLDPKVGTCTILKVNGKSPKMFIYIAAFGLPSVIFIGCYTRIYFAVRKASRKSFRKEDDMNPGRISFTVQKGWLRKSRKHTEMTEIYSHRERKELRVLRVMLVIFILYLVCYFPVSFVKIFKREDDLPILNVLGYLGVYFSNIINPVIYIVMGNEYRRAYKELFCQAKLKRQTFTRSY